MRKILKRRTIFFVRYSVLQHPCNSHKKSDSEEKCVELYTGKGIENIHIRILYGKMGFLQIKNGFYVCMFSGNITEKRCIIFLRMYN